jgi:WD repeat-containing protein mio
MDRPEPGLIRWSPNPERNSFLHVNLQHRVLRLYEPTGHAQRGNFSYQRLSQYDDFPDLTTWDWSPASAGLVAIGTSSGIVNLLRVDDDANSYMELPLKMARTCQAVAFNTSGQLAVGLDRVRTDPCLHIWDVERLGSFAGKSKGFPDVSVGEPITRLEPSVSVSSIRFFEDNPKTLVIGIKQQGLRIHDLRGESSCCGVPSWLNVDSPI